MLFRSVQWGEEEDEIKLSGEKGLGFRSPSRRRPCTPLYTEGAGYNGKISGDEVKPLATGWRDAERNFFVELWDVSGHDRYRDCRSLFYSQINGTPFSLPKHYSDLFFLSNQFGNGVIFVPNRQILFASQPVLTRFFSRVKYAEKIDHFATSCSSTHKCRTSRDYATSVNSFSVVPCLTNLLS